MDAGTGEDMEEAMIIKPSYEQVMRKVDVIVSNSLDVVNSFIKVKNRIF